MNALGASDFSAFFQEIHGHAPFPWQRRLVERLATSGNWPEVLDLPTGAGKTAAIDAAVFHLALEADRGPRRRAPVRIAFVVDRRLIVDDAHRRAKKIAAALSEPPGPTTRAVRERLLVLAGPDAEPLLARRLRGGIPREDDWARTPAQPTVLCSTVDQVGSRLLFRGYGVSDRMKPVHAGLLGADCLILLDEAHLAEPFRQTLAWVAHYRSDKWRDSGRSPASPWRMALLTATPGKGDSAMFSLDAEDRANPTLANRLGATKKVRLVLGGLAIGSDAARTDDATANNDEERLTALANEIRKCLQTLVAQGVANPAVCVVLNRVGRARSLYERLAAELADAADLLLLIGAARPVDRDELALRLDPIRTGNPRSLARPLIVVATQCIEAGVDVDFDGLISEAAPIDALRQRFGRLNRAGRSIDAYGAIIAMNSDVASRADDAVYGGAIAAAWAYLDKRARKPPHRGEAKTIDFSQDAFVKWSARSPVPDEAYSRKDDAPVLLPAHLDLLTHTSPVPACDPEVSLYLHGPTRQPASVSVLWRADIDPTASIDLRRLLLLVPPRTAEAIELPLWAVRAWLEGRGKALARLADIPDEDANEDQSARRHPRRVYRWAGDDPRSAWADPDEIRAGDTLIVPAAYGGVDSFGWNPESGSAAVDVADAAASPFAGRRYAVRVAPGLVAPEQTDSLSEVLAAHAGAGWFDLRAGLLRLALSEDLRAQLDALDRARGRRVEVLLDIYGFDTEGRPRGVVFLARYGLTDGAIAEEGAPGATEDDIAGSIPGFSVTLEVHSADVESMARGLAHRAGLSQELVDDVALAGFLHDFGKADPRWQRWLQFDDPLNADPQHVLAKSARPLPRHAWASSGLPNRWRHEALSVRLARCNARLGKAHDPELVLWLVGTHHGYGRPLYPHADPLDDVVREDLPSILGLPARLPKEPGPQSLAFDYRGLDWAGLFERLKTRYGVWELARLEAILRLADHRASEMEAARARNKRGET